MRPQLWRYIQIYAVALGEQILEWRRQALRK
jgi:hypothetical protein